MYVTLTSYCSSLLNIVMRRHLKIPKSCGVYHCSRFVMNGMSINTRIDYNGSFMRERAAAALPITPPSYGSLEAQETDVCSFLRPIQTLNSHEKSWQRAAPRMRGMATSMNCINLMGALIHSPWVDWELAGCVLTLIRQTIWRGATLYLKNINCKMRLSWRRLKCMKSAR